MSTKSAVPKWAKGLDDLEVSFVREYLKDLSKTDAYLRCPGVTDNRDSCNVLGHRISMRPHVAAAIEAAMHEDGAGPRQWLIGKLQRWADSNIADFFEWKEGEGDDAEPVAMLKPWKNMPRELTSCVSEIIKRKDGSIRLKLHDPLRAAEILGKVGAIALTREHVVIDDPAVQVTPDVELARRIAFLLTKAARQKAKPSP